MKRREAKRKFRVVLTANNVQKANSFNDYFISIGETLAEER